jgi:cytochrome c-type biogenesis protein CcmH
MKFVIACTVMMAVALVLIVRPLLKARATTDAATPSSKSYLAVIATVILIPVAASLLYAKIGRLHWQEEIANATSGQAASSPEVLAMVAKLEQRLRDAPNDIDGWLLLGRSYAALEKPSQALMAYQKAYDLSGGDNVDATMGLGEAMIMTDEHAIVGKAGELFEAVLAKEPNNPKALWYGAIGALTSGNLPRAHERLQRILVLNPPQEVRTIIERQLQDIEQQLSAAGQTVPKVAQEKRPQSNRAMAVQVSLAPSLAKNLDKRTPLFVLARDPAAPGPPLAAVRRAVGDLPLSVTITDNDAMIQGRGIGSVTRVQVVARISKSGAPQAQPGDLYGEAEVDFAAKQSADVKILIDRAVEVAGAK